MSQCMCGGCERCQGPLQPDEALPDLTTQERIAMGKLERHGVYSPMLQSERKYFERLCAFGLATDCGHYFLSATVCALCRVSLDWCRCFDNAQVSQ